ncbi:MAG: S-layer homology domain-containing protein [Chloroflexi bacterium]|nr:S-layer homology domain-containing protein [Chloroflexota bacterium]
MKAGKSFHRILKVLTALMLVIHFLGGALIVNAAGGTEAPTSVRGQLIVLWGDAIGNATDMRYYLRTEDSRMLRVNPTEAQIQALGGAGAANRQWVAATGTWSTGNKEAGIEPSSLTLAGGRQSPNAGLQVSGAQPWVTILCKFSDMPDEPGSLPYFQGMYGAAWPGLDHYWRELSNNEIELTGSAAFGWFTLPNPRVYYNPTDTMGGMDLYALAADCTAAADASVDFAQYAGINMMFNADLDGYAWGGSLNLLLDGVDKIWMTTWLPPWGYTDLAVTSHEMGHGFGLPHSFGPWGGPYDNVWDVMSGWWSNCDISRDDTYGCLGQHTISYHKDMLGWVATERKFLAPDSGDMAPGESSSATITLEQLALPQTENYLLAQIPVDDGLGSFYTLEARRKTGYDVKLPGEGVVIHKVTYGTATVLDADDNGDTSDDGTIWTVGETFTDIQSGLVMTVDSETSSGYTVTITVSGPDPNAPPVTFDKRNPNDGSELWWYPSNPVITSVLAWGPSRGAESYEYCLDMVDNDACDTQWLPGPAEGYVELIDSYVPGVYSWQVRSTNLNGTTHADDGDWWNFQIVLAPSFPLEPGLPLSPDSPKIDTRQPTFLWTEVLGATQYFLEVVPGDECKTFSEKVIEVSLSGTSFTPAEPLNDNARYCWRIKTKYAAYESPYSAVYQFTIGNPTTFADVPIEHWAWQYIESLYNAGITGGCSTDPLNFCPDQSVTRAQAAVFLLVAEHGSGYTPPAASGIFNDVPANNGFAPWIEQFFNEGITGGCGNGNYCPNSPVTREQMAVFLMVAKYGSGYTPPAATGVFNDVPADYPFAPWIEALAAEGITGGCGGGNFCPKGTVTRAQMAVFLVTAFNLP